MINTNDVDTKPGEAEFLQHAAETTAELVRMGMPIEAVLAVSLVVAELSEYVGRNFVYHGLDTE